MRKLFYYFAIMMTACSFPQLKVDPNVLVETDLSFSEMSEAKGMKAAFLAFADKDVIKLQNQSFPIWGIDEMMLSFDDFDDTGFTLTWQPLKAEIAASGDLGYTIGNWKMVSSNGVKYGNYVSVWKKQGNGEWKYVVDTGTETPGEFKP